MRALSSRGGLPFSMATKRSGPARFLADSVSNMRLLDLPKKSTLGLTVPMSEIPDDPLSERAQHLLRVLVESYIREGQPVGSRTSLP